jgi:hypothetical protein
MKNIRSPKTTAAIIKTVFINPVTEKDKRMSIVDIMNPELRMTLWNSSVWKNENNRRNTSTIIKTVKNCSKNTLFKF